MNQQQNRVVFPHFKITESSVSGTEMNSFRSETDAEKF